MISPENLVTMLMMNILFSSILLVYPSHDLNQAGTVTHSVHNGQTKFTSHVHQMCTCEYATYLHLNHKCTTSMGHTVMKWVL